MSHARYYFLTTIILSLIACPAFAQRDRDTFGSSATAPGEIFGQVRMAESNSPVKNISVRLERFGGGLIEEMMTDGNGKFRFAGLKRDQYTVAVRIPRFTPAQQQVDLQFVLRAYLLIDLSPEKTGTETNSTNVIVDARVPAEAQMEFEKGRAIAQEKRAEQALSHLERSINLYPDFLEAHLLIGTLYLERQQYAKAETALLRATQINPSTASAFISLGEVYRRQKRYVDAEKALKEGLALNENSWQGHFTLGRVYWEMGEPMKAGPPIGRTLQLKPDKAEAHLLAGNIFLRLNLADRALIEYEEYLRLAPKGEFAGQTRELVEKIKRK
jgi:tetratricopeptide (TPR) repeat protein